MSSTLANNPSLLFQIFKYLPIQDAHCTASLLNKEISSAFHVYLDNGAFFEEREWLRPSCHESIQVAQSEKVDSQCLKLWHSAWDKSYYSCGKLLRGYPQMYHDLLYYEERAEISDACKAQWSRLERHVEPTSEKFEDLMLGKVSNRAKPGLRLQYADFSCLVRNLRADRSPLAANLLKMMCVLWKYDAVLCEEMEGLDVRSSVDSEDDNYPFPLF